MPVVGVDAHKKTHTLVAVDDLGRKLGEKTVAATSEGLLIFGQGEVAPVTGEVLRRQEPDRIHRPHAQVG